MVQPHVARALLLDDASFERSPLLAALAAEGVQTTRLPSHTDISAGSSFAANPPDLVLLALDVGGIAMGEARAKELLGLELLDTIPLLLITPSDVDAGRLGRLLAEGAFDYLDARFGIPILRSRIQAALRWGRRMRSSADAPERTSEPTGLPSLPPVPLTQRTLRVTGAIVRGGRRTGASFDVALDDMGRMTLFAFHSTWSEADAPIRSFAVRRAIREALDLGRPLDSVAADALATLRAFSSDGVTPSEREPGATMGLALLRFSADASTLEILDCGFAPIFELRTDGTLVALAQPSAPLGADESPHFSSSMVPVELGHLYFVTSDHTASPIDETLHTLLGSLGSARPVALASMSESELRQVWGDAVGVVSGDPPESDMVVLVAASDPSHVSSLRP